MKKILCILLCLILCSCEVYPEDFPVSPWETITKAGHFIDSYRMYVPGGWIVLARISSGTACTFVPDAKHEWKVFQRKVPV